MALRHRFTSVFIVVTLLTSVGCGATARLAVADGTGPNPVLPPPKKTLLPKVHVVSAKGWEAGETPTAAEGLRVQAFAGDLVGCIN